MSRRVVNSQYSHKSRTLGTQKRKQRKARLHHGMSVFLLLQELAVIKTNNLCGILKTLLWKNNNNGIQQARTYQSKSASKTPSTALILPDTQRVWMDSAADFFSSIFTFSSL